MRDIALGHVPARPGIRILDLGCGTGSLAFELAAARPDASITGIDVSDANIRVARERLAHSRHGDRVTFQQADYLAHAGRPYDAIVTDGVLHLIPGSTRTLVAKLGRDLTPGGLLICAMPYDCFYNRAFAVVRRALRRVRGSATDALILRLARALHGKEMDDARLRERVQYMYIPPARLETKSLREDIAPAAGLYAVAQHPMPSSSPSQLKHRVTVFEKRAS
jgi:trans-aconitate methyltransferase